MSQCHRGPWRGEGPQEGKVLTLEKLRELEGKMIILTSRNNSVYLGKLYNIVPVSQKERNIGPFPSGVAFARFDYTRWYTLSMTEIVKKVVERQEPVDFPIFTTDLVVESQGHEHLVKILKEHGYEF